MFPIEFCTFKMLLVNGLLLVTHCSETETVISVGCQTIMACAEVEISDRFSPRFVLVKRKQSRFTEFCQYRICEIFILPYFSYFNKLKIRLHVFFFTASPITANFMVNSRSLQICFPSVGFNYCFVFFHGEKKAE